MLEKNEFLDFSHPEFLDVELCSALIKYHLSHYFRFGFVFRVACMSDL